MKSSFKFFIFFLVVSACSTSNVGDKKKLKECAKNYENDFGSIEELNRSLIVNGESSNYTQIKFQCTRSALYNLRTMYNLFGKWDKSIIPADKPRPYLMWEDVNLFSDGHSFNVITFGEENSRDDISTSFIILNNKNEDLLGNNQALKDKAIEFFSENLRNHQNESNEFYIEFLKEFAPKQWKKYKNLYN